MCNPKDKPEARTDAKGHRDTQPSYRELHPITGSPAFAFSPEAR
jgi:hypothetical protein